MCQFSQVPRQQIKKGIAACTKPGPYHVICARGADVKKHAGNVLFKQKIQEGANAYHQAESKLFKSLHVSSVISFFEENGGGFVKNCNGVWCKVSEQLAREKVGQALRDQLSSQYKSSTKSKRRRWKQEAAHNVILTQSYDKFIQTSESVRERMEAFNQKRFSFPQAPDGDVMASDDALLHLFTTNNLELLNTIVNDRQIQHFMHATNVH